MQWGKIKEKTFVILIFVCYGYKICIEARRRNFKYNKYLSQTRLLIQSLGLRPQCQNFLH